MIEHYSSLVDNSTATISGADGMTLAIEECEVELLLKLLYQCTQGWLAHAARLGGSLKMAMLIKRHNVF